MPELATWADLPLEILEQIIAHCDTPTLLFLSYLNTQLNTLALDLLLKRENVTNPKQGYFVSRLAPREVIPALNAALWLDHLPHVTYYLNPDVKRLFSEIRGLERLVGRLPKNGRLDLYFSSVDRWFSDSAPERMAGELAKIDPVVWSNIFIRLLEMALSKGCLSMRIEGGHRLQIYYMDDPVREVLRPPSPVFPVQSVSRKPESRALVTPSPQAGAHPTPARSPSLPSPISLRKKVTRWIGKRLGLKVIRTHTPSPPDSIPVTPIIQVDPSPLDPLPSPADPEGSPIAVDDPTPKSFQTSTPCLKTLNLRSSMMLQPLFFSHTLNLIHAHSSKLEHLDLVSVKTSQDVWAKFFSSMTLAVLEVFTYQYDTLIVEEPVITPTLLLDFFTRHPSLKIIELYGVCVGGQHQEFQVEFPTVNQGLLPNLEHLDAHPKIVSWLLGSPIACPKLARVFLSSEYMASRLLVTHPHHNSYADFDAGIRTISALLSPSPDLTHTSSQEPRPIHLHFKFSTEDSLLEWFLSHTAPNSTQSSVLELLTNVSRLTISAHYHTKFEIEHRQVLPLFLGLMPNVRELELIELPYPDEVRDGVFIQDVKVHVKNLERFVIGRTVVWDKEGYEGSVDDRSWGC